MEANSAQKFLIDGFPRNEDNLTGWEKQMDGKANVKFMLFIECPEKVRDRASGWKYLIIGGANRTHIRPDHVTPNPTH